MTSVSGIVVVATLSLTIYLEQNMRAHIVAASCPTARRKNKGPATIARGKMDKLTKFPSETDPPGSLMKDLAAIRNEALKQGDFNSAVLLSHVHAWLYWMDKNYETLRELSK
jgi:hypothetical protein